MDDKIVSEIEIHASTTGADRAVAELDKLVRTVERTTKVTESADRALNKLARQDPLFRATKQLEQSFSAINRAQSQGFLTESPAMSAAMRAIENQKAKLAALTGGGTAQKGLGNYELINMSRQAQDIVVSIASGQHAMMVMLQQGSQVYDILASHNGGFTSGVKAMGESLLGLLSPFRVMGAAGIGAFAGIQAAASAVENKLAEIGKAAEKTGFSPSQVQGARITGARAGLDRQGVDSALASASAQFLAYTKNTGDVLSTLKEIDNGFLAVADSAHNAGDFVDLMTQEIRKLPTVEGLDLAQKLFGADQGKALFDSIRNGEMSMRGLGDAAAKAGALNDEAARKAADLQKQIAGAAEVADSKLLLAFQNLGSPVDSLKLSWYGVVGQIADAIAASQALQGVFQGLLHPIDTILGAPSAISKAVTGQASGSFGRMIPFSQSGIPQAQFDAAKSAWMASGPTIGALTAGDSRSRFQSYSDAMKRTKGAGGKSDAEKEAEKYAQITKDLEEQIKLVSSVGDAHKQVQAEIDKANWLEKLGANASAEHKDRVGELADKLRAAREEQDKLNESAKTFNDAYKSVTGSVSGGLKDLLLNGGKPKDVAASFLKSTNGNIFDAAMTGSGPMAKLLNMEGKDGAVGGLFGSIASMLHLDGKSMNAQTMNVTAANVNMSGGIPGVPGANVPGVGGLFSGLGNLFQPAKDGGGGGGFFSGIGDWLSSTLHFAEGGIMGPTGPIPLRAYAGGGVANSPQLALFGEGSGPEAYVPLRSGKIPVAMDGAHKGQNPGVTVHNYAGVDVEPRITKGHVEIIVGKRVAQAMSQVPSMMAAYDRSRP